MAKAKFERTKPHCNIGTIGHVTMVKQLLQRLLPRLLTLDLEQVKLLHSKISIRLQKREKEESQFLLLTLSMRQRRDIMHTLTAQAMPIM